MELSSLCSSHEGSSGPPATKSRGMLLLRFAQRGVTGLPNRQRSGTCNKISPKIRHDNNSVDSNAHHGVFVAHVDTRRRVLAASALPRNALVNVHRERTVKPVAISRIPLYLYIERLISIVEDTRITVKCLQRTLRSKRGSLNSCNLAVASKNPVKINL